MLQNQALNLHSLLLHAKVFSIALSPVFLYREVLKQILVESKWQHADFC